MTAETIVTGGAVLSAAVGLVTLVWRLFRWVEHQQEQDERMDRLAATHCSDQEATQAEQTLIVYGLLACLKGLAEQGCNGPVSEAIDKLEKHINQKAHGQI